MFNIYIVAMSVVSVILLLIDNFLIARRHITKAWKKRRNERDFKRQNAADLAEGMKPLLSNTSTA